MPRRERSPIRVGDCKPWPFKRRPGERHMPALCRWVCVRNPRGAEFVNRRDGETIAILHPSTKKPGQWQVSRFDASGAIGDIVRPTCTETLYDSGILPATWKLRSVAQVDEK